jgi:hypothetical protein
MMGHARRAREGYWQKGTECRGCAAAASARTGGGRAAVESAAAVASAQMGGGRAGVLVESGGQRATGRARPVAISQQAAGTVPPRPWLRLSSAPPLRGNPVRAAASHVARTNVAAR